MGSHYLSRREILERIVDVSRGACLLPFGAPEGARSVLRGRIVDQADNLETAAKIRVTDLRTGQECWPERAIQTRTSIKRENIKHFFYARGNYELALDPGRYRVEVVRGICHEPVEREVEISAGRTARLDFALPVLRDMRAAGWYSGNTHTHYQVMQPDESPDERLRLVPPAEALDICVISYLIRKDLNYATNRYPIGLLPEFSKHGTLVDMGEECRNNAGEWGAGYGHILFLNIPRLIEPVSTGALSRRPGEPDFPTISMIAERARQAGGTTVWCHNGNGMEMPVAAALGVIDAFNVADSSDPTYDLYYRLLNCGLRMPLSTGTDWWIYDHNRVFVHLSEPFSYAAWLDGLRRGRTFATNGPLLEFTVDGRGPGSEVRPRKIVRVKASAVSRVPFDRLEIVHDGQVVADKPAAGGMGAALETEIEVQRTGWLAARVVSSRATRAGMRPFAHSGPVYLRAGQPSLLRREAAGAFVKAIDDSVEFIRKKYRFASDADRAIALGRFAEGRKRFV